MSLLTPERMPVKIYKWDDAGAPALDKTAGCMMTIFKACLITGYGTKESVGWTMPYEDTTAKVKVFRPAVSPHTDFYLRVSADSGKQITAQVYQNMTAQNKGTLRLQCATPFRYGVSTEVSGKWLLIASSRGFWFFNEQNYYNDINKTGSFFYCGDSTASSAGDRQIYLQHTGGLFTDGNFVNLLGWSGEYIDKTEGGYLAAKTLSNTNTVSIVDLQSISSGMLVLTTDDVVTPPVFFASNHVYRLPGLYVPLAGAVYNNFDAVTVNKNEGVVNCVNFGTSAKASSNLYVAIDEWVF